jgi:hypothetical protein
MPVGSMAQPESPLLKDLEILLDAHFTGTLAANGRETSLPTSAAVTPGATNGSLGPGEYGEVLAEEYWAPFAPDGTPEDLRRRYLILDGKGDSRAWWYESGRADLNVAPPAHQRFDKPGSLVLIGGGILEAAAIVAAGPLDGEDEADMMGRAILALAVPRYQTSCIVVNEADVNPVADPRHTRLWGFRWTADTIRAIARRFADSQGRPPVFGGRVRVKDPWFQNGKGLVVEFDLPLVPLAPEYFTKLAGGMDQDQPSVWPFRRWAINAQATNGQQSEYDFSYTGAAGSNVSQTDQFQNLDFNYAPGGSGTQATVPNVLVATGWGVRALVRSADANQTDLTASGSEPPLGSQYFRVITDTPREAHPNNGLPASNNDNPLHFGWTYPNAGPGQSPVLYRPLRRQLNYRRVIANLRGVVAMQDNGSVVPANTVGAMVEGLLIQNAKPRVIG